MGVVKDYNGVNIIQTPDYIEMSSKSYIDRLLKLHGCDTMSLKPLPNKNHALCKNAIPLYPIPPTATAASLNKFQVNREDGLPVQPISDNNNNDDSTQINYNPSIYSDPNKKISKLMCPLPTNCIEPMYANEGPLENTTGHVILEKKKGLNYCTLLGKSIYAYITCHPDIGYIVTTL